MKPTHMSHKKVFDALTLFDQVEKVVLMQRMPLSLFAAGVRCDFDLEWLRENVRCDCGKKYFDTHCHRCEICLCPRGECPWTEINNL